jgi:hypothetical protein
MDDDQYNLVEKILKFCEVVHKSEDVFESFQSCWKRS